MSKPARFHAIERVSPKGPGLLDANARHHQEGPAMKYYLIGAAVIAAYVMTGFGVWSAVAAREPNMDDAKLTLVGMWPAVLVGMTVDRIYYPARGCAN